MKMNPEIKKRWLEALRSGEYQQTTGVLRDNMGFCCLGVLTDLAIKDDVPALRWDSEGAARWHGQNWSAATMERSATSVLPRPVVDWSGLNTGDPHVRPERTELRLDDEDAVEGILSDMRAEGSVTLSALNDANLSFEGIADIIEEHL